MTVVLDASVALKWQFEDEEATGSAMALLDDFIEGRLELISPSLFLYEIVNALNVGINRKRIKEVDGYRAITYLISLGIELRNFDDLVETTFRTARQHGLSPYDCAYIALAEKEGCDFITGDKKLFKMLKTHLPWVKWVGDY